MTKPLWRDVLDDFATLVRKYEKLIEHMGWKKGKTRDKDCLYMCHEIKVDQI